MLRQLGPADDAEHVNPNGGAIALGHPLGMSGARLAADGGARAAERDGGAMASPRCASASARAWRWRVRAMPGVRGTDEHDLSAREPRGRSAVRCPPDYISSTRLRAPPQPLVVLPHTLSELTGPVYGHESVRPNDADLTRQHAGEPLGERIIVTGRVLDEDGRPVPEHAGRDLAGQRGRPLRPRRATSTLRRSTRTSPAPAARVTDADGRYRFVTIKPGAYPWRNHHNAWRPAHIHFSLFGPASSRGWSRRCTSPATRCSRSTRSSTRSPTTKARERG